jgi:hypothetical protein
MFAPRTEAATVALRTSLRPLDSFCGSIEGQQSNRGHVSGLQSEPGSGTPCSTSRIGRQRPDCRANGLFNGLFNGLLARQDRVELPHRRAQAFALGLGDAHGSSPKTASMSHALRSTRTTLFVGVAAWVRGQNTTQKRLSCL